ncbi:hypothetical protein D3C84_742920 [compost metagenome]
MRLVGCQQRGLAHTSFILTLRQWLGLMAQDCALRLLSQLSSQVVFLVEALGAGGLQKPCTNNSIQWVVYITAQNLQCWGRHGAVLAGEMNACQLRR